MTTSAATYHYPNRMGRIILSTARNIMSDEDYARYLELAGLSSFLQHPPASDLDLGFPFESVSALQIAAEKLYGVQGGREFNERVGVASLDGGLGEFNPMLGIADLPMRAMPLGLKLHLGFDMLSSVFNRFTDQRVEVSEDPQVYKWTITRCPVCWGRHTDEPCCQLAVGILRAGLTWVSGGKHFRVVETQCVAMGAPNCLITIDKRPI